MNTKELLELYNKISRPHELRNMSLWQLTIDTHSYNTATDAMTVITKFAPLAGWLGFQSVTSLFRNHALPQCTDTTGLLLNAEVVNTTGESLHIRYDSAGGWIATRYAYTPNGEYLADNVNLAIHGSPGGFMCYRRFWQIDLTHGPIPFAACLIDIELNLDKTA